MTQWPEFSPTPMLERLVARGVDFVVVGGIAVVLHGSARLTQDLDISYASDDTNLEQLGAVLIELGARLRGVDDDLPFVPDARTLRQTSVLCLATDLGIIDLLAQPAGAPPYDELRAQAVRLNLGDFAVLVASIEDLIAMKRTAGRNKDLADIDELEAIRRLSRERRR
jgi:predicted nucleotidyltransferase